MMESLEETGTMIGQSIACGDVLVRHEGERLRLVMPPASEVTKSSDSVFEAGQHSGGIPDPPEPTIDEGLE